MHSSIFCGRVRHSRTAPLAHSFQYRLYMMYLDLDELDEVFEGRWFWSVSRPSLARFERRNYLGNPTEPLNESVRNLVQDRTGVRPTGPIRLLSNLSYFGYCVNPISLYYCFDAGDTRIDTIVAEVTNTPWGERHCYVLSDDMNEGNDQAQRFITGKELHVSPFIGMDVSYDWLLTQPSSDLVVRISNRVAGRRFFTATMVMQRAEITGWALAKVLLAYPFMTAKIILGIHWQALRLWLKGCPVQTHPGKRSSMQASQ